MYINITADTRIRYSGVVQADKAEYVCVHMGANVSVVYMMPRTTMVLCGRSQDTIFWCQCVGFILFYTGLMYLEFEIPILDPCLQGWRKTVSYALRRGIQQALRCALSWGRTQPFVQQYAISCDN